MQFLQINLPTTFFSFCSFTLLLSSYLFFGATLSWWKNFFRHVWNQNDHQILLQNFLSKSYWWKKTHSLSKVPICSDIETFTDKLPWTLQITSIFSFADDVKNHFLVWKSTHWLSMFMRLSHKTWSGACWLQISTSYHISLISLSPGYLKDK